MSETQQAEAASKQTYGVNIGDAEAICDPAIICRIEQFYYRESRILDERKYQQWQGLLEDDIEYTVPSRFIATPNPRQRGTEDFHALEHELERGGVDNVPLRIENIFQLAIRIDRAYKVNAWAENPPARTRRFVSNVEVYQGPEGFICFNNFMMTYSRHDNANFTYTGQRRDILRDVDGQLKIAKREVIHDWNIIPVPTMGLFF